jgi:hypothetical protein
VMGAFGLGDRPRVKVREQFYRGERRRLKSSHARGDIPLSAGLAARLLTHRRDTYKGPDAPVFPSKVGTPLSAPSLPSASSTRPARRSGWSG